MKLLGFKPASPLLSPRWGSGATHSGRRETLAPRRATWEVDKEGAPDTHFCWSFMVSMMPLSSRTCVLSSSTAAWLLAAGSIFGFPSEPNRDGELALCPAVPKEDDRGEDVAEARGAGPPPPPAAMVPGLGGRDALLSDTCGEGRQRGFRPGFRVQSSPPSTSPYPPLETHSSLTPSPTSPRGPTWHRHPCFKFDRPPGQVVPNWFNVQVWRPTCLRGSANSEVSKTFS